MATSEDTNVVVRKMLKQRRSMRVPIIIGAVLVAAFVGYMVIGFGNKDRKAELTVDGPVYSGKTMGGRVEEQAPAPGGGVPHDKPADGAASTVEVAVIPRDAVLWVDGKQVGGGAKHVLSLAPGKHVLMFQQKERTTMQKLTLGAGETYRVEMRDKVTFAKVH